MNRTNKNKCDVHFFTDFDEYEYIRRSIYQEQISIADATRDLWFYGGWREDLDNLRKLHRKQKIEDKRFWHKKQIEQEKIKK